MKRTKRISIRDVDTIFIAYSAFLFKDIRTIRNILDKKGSYFGMSYYKFISFVSIDFEKPAQDAFFNSDEMPLDSRYIDLAFHPGMICYMFKSRNPRILFLPGSNSGMISEIKFSIHSVSEWQLENQLRMYDRENHEHLDLILKN